MAESKRTFQAARMDKDIDDRILKSGQYRDGLNISVDTSEDANVGAIENLKGNELILNQDIYGLSASSNPNATVVGSYPHPEEQKIYYFVTGDASDGIFEYDIVNNTVKTIIIESSTLGGSSSRPGDSESLPELKCENAKVKATINQMGVVTATSEIGNAFPRVPKFDENTTTSTLSKEFFIEVRAEGYRNSNIFCPVDAVQDAKTAPEVFTVSSTDITNTTAILTGSLGVAVGVTEIGFKYGYHSDGNELSLSDLQGTSGGSLTIASASNTSNISSPFRGNATTLPANKTIYYVAYAVNSVGTGYGIVKKFTTANTIYKITNIYFETTPPVAGAGGTAVLVVEGQEGAQYSLASSDTGVTISDSGTQTLENNGGGNGKNKHNVVLAAQAVGAAARTITVNVTQQGSSDFISLELDPNNDGVSSVSIAQAAGANQQYTYILQPNATLSNSTLKQSASSSGSTYTRFEATTENPSGYEASTSFFVYPDAGYQFSDFTDDALDTLRDSITNSLPDWADLDNVVLVKSREEENDSYIQISIDISIPADTASTTEYYNFTASASQVKSTWKAGLFSASAGSVNISLVEGTKPFVYTGTSQNADQDPKTIEVTDVGYEITEPTVTKDFDEGGATYVSYNDNLTAGGGDTEVDINFTIDPDDEQRRNIEYDKPAIELDFGSREKSFLHTINLVKVGATTEFEIRDSIDVDENNNPTGNIITNIQESFNASSGTFEKVIYIWPVAGQEFASQSTITTSFTDSPVPSWATIYFTQLGGGNNAYTYFAVGFRINPQKKDVTATASIDANPTEVSVTWNRIVDIEGAAKAALDEEDFTLGESKTVTASSSPDTFELSADVLNGASVTDIEQNKGTEYGGNLITLNGDLSFTDEQQNPTTLPLENSGTITADLTADVSGLRKSVNFTEDAPITWNVVGSTPTYTTKIYGRMGFSIPFSYKTQHYWVTARTLGQINVSRENFRYPYNPPSYISGLSGELGNNNTVFFKPGGNGSGTYYGEFNNDNILGHIATVTGSPGDEFQLGFYTTFSSYPYGTLQAMKDNIIRFDRAGTTGYETLEADRPAIVSIHCTDYDYNSWSGRWEYGLYSWTAQSKKYVVGMHQSYNMKFKILNRNATVYLVHNHPESYTYANFGSSIDPTFTPRLADGSIASNALSSQHIQHVQSGVPVLLDNGTAVPVT